MRQRVAVAIGLLALLGCAESEPAEARACDMWVDSAEAFEAGDSTWRDHAATAGAAHAVLVESGADGSAERVLRLYVDLAERREVQEARALTPRMRQVCDEVTADR